MKMTETDAPPNGAGAAGTEDARPPSLASLTQKMDAFEEELGKVKGELAKTQKALVLLLTALRAQAAKQTAAALAPKIQQAVEAKLLAQTGGGDGNGQDMESLLASLGITDPTAT